MGAWIEAYLKVGVLGLIAIVYMIITLKIQKSREREYEKMFDNIIENKKLVEDIMKDIRHITDEQKSNSKENKSELIQKIELIQKVIFDLSDKYKISMEQIIRIIYEERLVAPDTFRDFADALNFKHIYKLVIFIMETIDNNGFNNDDVLYMLKRNICNNLEIYKNNFEESIREIPYDENRKNEFIGAFKMGYSDFYDELKIYIDNITYDDIKNDKNYIIFKSVLKDKIWNFSREVSQSIEFNSKLIVYNDN